MRLEERIRRCISGNAVVVRPGLGTWHGRVAKVALVAIKFMNVGVDSFDIRIQESILGRVRRLYWMRLRIVPMYGDFGKKTGFLNVGCFYWWNKCAALASYYVN